MTTTFSSPSDLSHEESNVTRARNCEAAPLPRLNYKPNEEEKKKFCESESFRNCSRHMAFLDYLRAKAKK